MELNSILWLLLLIFLVLITAVLLFLFKPMLRGKTAFREVNGLVEDDKSLKSALKSNNILLVEPKSHKLHCSMEEAGFEIDNSVTDEELASIVSV